MRHTVITSLFPQRNIYIRDFLLEKWHNTIEHPIPESTIRRLKNNIQNSPSRDDTNLLTTFFFEISDYLAYCMTAFRIGKHIPVTLHSGHICVLILASSVHQRHGHS